MINYDEIAGKYDEMFGSPEFTDEDKLLFPLIKKEVGLNESHRVLDIGCGTGLVLEKLDIAPENYLGIDPSIEMIKKAKAKFPKHNFLVSTFEDLHINEKFDVIISTYGSFAYVNPRQFKNVWEFLKDGGKMFLMFYTPEYAKYVYDVVYKNSGYKAEIEDVVSHDVLSRTFPRLLTFNKNWIVATN